LFTICAYYAAFGLTVKAVLGPVKEFELAGVMLAEWTVTGLLVVI
jgi:hypothetical protein